MAVTYIQIELLSPSAKYDGCRAEIDACVGPGIRRNLIEQQSNRSFKHRTVWVNADGAAESPPAKLLKNRKI